MARGREEADWLRTQVVVMRLSALWAKEGYKPEHCNPYYTKPKRSKMANERAMDGLLAGLDKAYGGR